MKYIKTICLAFVSIVITASMIKFLYFAMDFKRDTVALTNVGFALLVGLTSITFSWARTFELKKETHHKDTLNRTGSYGVLSAIMFLLSSALKFFYNKINDSYIDWIFTLSSMVCMCTAVVLACIIVTNLFTVFLDIRLEERYQIDNTPKN